MGNDCAEKVLSSPTSYVMAYANTKRETTMMVSRFA